jgi:aspartyl-tRNA(Asn)/glutamyl-tRNA(Gln) amidotransferase subunit B
MSWEVVIGLETHTQLSTKSKIFSGASTAFGAPPNTQASAVDIALPGVLPVLNRGAVERAIRFGLAVDGAINRRSVFARKNYFYPDLPKGYQISQYEIPVVKGGALTIATDAGEKTIRLTRAHLEEDAGKSLHEGLPATAGDVSGIDLNRAGTPLLEIVSEPELRSSAEAVAYAKKLHALVVWIGICDGNMQEGSFRCDANVSVRRPGEPLGTRCEIKNLNSFRFLERAIAFEVRRQIELLEDGGRVVQQTRLYDADRDETRAMRSKEDAHDYRYFPDPDLPPLAIDEAWIERVEASMPELPEAMKVRFVTQYAVPAHDALMLTQSRDMAAYFEEAVRAFGGEAKLVANWMLGELAAWLNREDVEISQACVSPRQLGALLTRIADGTISSKAAKQVFDELWRANPRGHFVLRAEGAQFAVAGEDATLSVDRIIERHGLKQVSDESAIGKLVDDAIAANASIVAEYRSGREKAFNALVGKVMAASRGKANPAQVNALLREKLGRAS